MNFHQTIAWLLHSSPLIWISNQFTVLHQIDLFLLFSHQALWQEGTTAFAKCKKNMLLQSHRFLHCSMSKRLQLEPSTPSTTISPFQTPSPMIRGYNFLNLYVFLVVIFTSVSWHAFVSILQPQEDAGIWRLHTAHYLLSSISNACRWEGKGEKAKSS